MKLCWLQLGTLTLLAFGPAQLQAQSPKADRDGGLLPPVIQVVAREPIDEEEITVELIKAMPRTKEEMKKQELGDNFKVIKIKRDKTDDPIKMTSEETKPAAPPARPEPEKKTDKSSDTIVKVRRDEPLNFLPTEKQKALPTTSQPATPVRATASGLVREVRPPRVISDPPAATDSKPAESTPAPGSSTLLSLSMPDMGLPSTFLGSEPNDTGFPSLADSNVGWIDSALIGTQARLRYDARWHNSHPDRAEYFVGRSKQYFDGFDISGRGLSVPESNIDMFEGVGYFEWAINQRFSVFYEMPIRYIRPTENDTAIGVGDINFGTKIAYFMMPEQVQTFQLRLTMPTGKAGLALGTGHVVIEPSLLLWQKLTDLFTLESELRNWIPVGGTNYSGYTLRYALGLSYNMYENERFSLKPVTELIGWSTFRGFQSDFIDSLPTFQSTEDARGTVIESAWGLRGTVLGNCDWYTGYSFAITHTSWFDHNFRFELRWRF